MQELPSCVRSAGGLVQDPAWLQLIPNVSRVMLEFAIPQQQF